MPKNTKGEAVYEGNRYSPCSVCHELTQWSDGVCTDCEDSIPDYLPSSQIDRFLIMKRKKHENSNSSRHTSKPI